MNDVQRLEAERLRPVREPDKLGEMFRELLSLLDGMCRDAGCY